MNQHRISGDANFLILAVLEPAIADLLGISQAEAVAELAARECETCDGERYLPERNSLDSGSRSHAWVEHVLCPTCQNRMNEEVSELPL